MEGTLRKFETNLIETGWEKAPAWECLSAHLQVGLFQPVYVNIKMAGKQHNLELMWNRLMKHADLEKPTTFLDYVCGRVHTNVRITDLCRSY